MRTDITSMMSKMSGKDLGRLFLKDCVTGLANGENAYSVEDFEAISHKLDSLNAREFNRYADIFRFIYGLTMTSWWVSSVIEIICLKFRVICELARRWEIYGAAADLMLCQRLFHDDEWVDPDESETLLRDQGKGLSEVILYNKVGYETLHNALTSYLKRYLSMEKALSLFAERLEIPELASVVISPLKHVKDLKEQLDGLSEDSPYLEIFPDIDAESLEPDPEDVERFMSPIIKWLKD